MVRAEAQASKESDNPVSGPGADRAWVRSVEQARGAPTSTKGAQLERPVGGASESHGLLSARRTAETASSARGSSLSARLVGGSSTWRAQLRGAQDSMQRSCGATSNFKRCSRHCAARYSTVCRPPVRWLARQQLGTMTAGAGKHHVQDSMQRSCHAAAHDGAQPMISHLCPGHAGAEADRVPSTKPCTPCRSCHHTRVPLTG